MKQTSPCIVDRLIKMKIQDKLSDSIIALRLGITERTVRTHVKKFVLKRRQLGVSVDVANWHVS